MSSFACIKERMVTKLRSIAGDSLAEILIAILVVAFGALLLATMSTTSTKVIIQNQEEMDAVFAAERALATTVPNSGSAHISISGTAIDATVEVDVFEDDEERFVRYEMR